MTKSLQQEWQYLQRVVPDMGPAFQPLEEALCEVFLPALLQEEPPGTLLDSFCDLPVRLAGIGIPNPILTAPVNFATSQGCCTVDILASGGHFPGCCCLL